MQPSSSYAGDISPLDAWKHLCASGDALLIDVRTLPEWKFTGQPDVTAARGRLANISWKVYPQMQPNPQFVDEVQAQAMAKDAPLLFMCRSGGRSREAAIAMTAAGFTQCYNISGGFEGELDAGGQRGKVSGWKASMLPWKQA